jgi:hypothetical protein
MGITEPNMAFTDEEWDEVREDMPATDDPFLRKYLDGREALIVEEKKRRSGESSRQLLSQGGMLRYPLKTTLSGRISRR